MIQHFLIVSSRGRTFQATIVNCGRNVTGLLKNHTVEKEFNLFYTSQKMA